MIFINLILFWIRYKNDFFLRKEFLNIFSLEIKFCSGGLKYKPNELVRYFTLSSLWGYLSHNEEKVEYNL